METVTVSQAPAVSEAPAVATPAAGGATMATLPSAVQDLARFFLSLSGSSSFGAVGGVAGVAAPTSGVGVQLCPTAPGGDAVAPCAATAVPAVPAGVGGPPSASAAVLGPSGYQQHQETSRPSRRCRRASSDGTGRVSKKRPRGRCPSPSPSSRCRERSYRSSSDCSEDTRAKTSPPRTGRTHGGTPGDSRPAPAGDRSPRPGPSGRMVRSSFTQVAVVDPPLLREWRMMTVPVPSSRWTSIGMTLSDLSWPSSGTFTTWKNRQEYRQLGARLLLHRSMV